MKIEIELEQNEIDSPIRFATAIIEKCMNLTTTTIIPADKDGEE